MTRTFAGRKQARLLAGHGNKVHAGYLNVWSDGSTTISGTLCGSGECSTGSKRRTRLHLAADSAEITCSKCLMWIRNGNWKGG